MSQFVLDGSVALSWFLPDEAAVWPPVAVETMLKSKIHVPGLWHLEVAHGLLKAERRRRITEAERRSAIRFLSGLSIAIDDLTATQAWGSALALAERHRLTPYDASYLELAIRLTLPLATRDKELRAAASVCDVPLLD